MAVFEPSLAAFPPVVSKPLHQYEDISSPARALEAERLYAQYEVYGSSFDYLLHPRIQVPTQNPRIASVGVGTALILSELASRLPGTPELHGFETGIDSPEQLLNLASNVMLHDANLLLDFPAEFHGTFDIVNVRLLVTTIAGDDWRLVAKNLVSLLKPGGWLQWQEPDGLRSITISAEDNGARKSGLQAFIDEASGDSAVHDRLDYPSSQLEGILHEAGLHSVVQDVVSSDKQPYLRYNAAIVFLQDLSGIIGSTISGEKAGQEEIHNHLRECMDDLESGAYQRYNLLCFTGMKV